jgi:hypothetical protein
MNPQGLFQVLGPTPVPRHNKKVPMFGKFLTAAAVIPLVVACAPFAQAATRTLSQEQLAFVGQTCNQLLGLKPGETYFDGCRQTLASTLEAKIQDQALAWAYQSCSQQGLAPKNAAQSACVFDRQKSAPAAVLKPLRISNSANGMGKPTKSFYEMSPSQRFDQERYACAQLGFEPESASFGQCMTGLQGTFLLDPN